MKAKEYICRWTKKRKKEEYKNRRAKEKDRTMFSSFSFSTYLGEAACQSTARIYTQSRAGRVMDNREATASSNSTGKQKEKLQTVHSLPFSGSSALASSVRALFCIFSWQAFKPLSSSPACGKLFLLLQFSKWVTRFSVSVLQCLVSESCWN